jgi:DNA-binding beta-propeller fold protein YncE
MRLVLSLWLAACGVASAQLSPVPPAPTALPSNPFFITKTWYVGGVGDWDYLTIDPSANQLFIAHASQVQVVDVESGTLAGVISHMREAHAIVLDSQGAYGYISDGPADLVRVFDRRSFQIVASIPTGPSPRSMALDPTTGLLFVVGALQAGSNQPTNANQPSSPRRTPSGRAVNPPTGGAHGPESTVTVIDVERRVQLAQVVLAGMLGFAQGDGSGQIYITVPDRNQIIRLDAQGVGSAVHRLIDQQAAAEKKQQAAAQPATQHRPSDRPLQLDLSGQIPADVAEASPHSFSLDSLCERPRALAIDTSHERLFAACSNYRMVAIDAQSGHVVAQLPIGPGPDAIGYDPGRGLIFTANGAGDGSLTIIRQDVTDTYAVVQTLPTRQNARTLAINPATGEVYLAAVIYGAVLNNVNGAQIKMQAVDNSFQVLVVGN